MLAMPMLLVLNAGSSTLKFSVYAAESEPQPGTLLFSGLCDGVSSGAQADQGVRPNSPLRIRIHDAQQQMVYQADASDHSHAGALRAVLQWLPQVQLVAVGHRVVHGGLAFDRPLRVDSGVLQQLRQLTAFAPLHQPHNLAAIEAIGQLMPGVAQIACFDTAFHRNQAPVATAYALPQRIVDLGVRRYGFHGISYAYIAQRLPQLWQTAGLAPDPVVGFNARRVVVAHLGSGSSMCAIQGGKSVATTMGMTALDGLVMSTRCGQIDPGVILYLLQLGMTASDIEHLLYQESGLAGVSGGCGDMRELLARNDPAAKDAIDLFIYRIRCELGALVAALGGIDDLVFTAGIGEHVAVIRSRIGEDAAWLGVRLDPAANADHALCISSPNSRVRVWVLPTDEALMIAQGCWQLLH